MNSQNYSCAQTKKKRFIRVKWWVENSPIDPEPWSLAVINPRRAASHSTYPFAICLHVAALEGTAECVSVELLKQSAATSEEDVLGTPAFLAQLLEDLWETRQSKASNTLIIRLKENKKLRFLSAQGLQSMCMRRTDAFQGRFLVIYCIFWEDSRTVDYRHLNNTNCLIRTQPKHGSQWVTF